MNSTQIHRILVPVDFSEIGDKALEHGAYLANACRADLIILHSADGNGTPSDAADKLNNYAENYAKRYGIFVKPISSIGKASKKIAEAVVENDIDLIVMGTHGVGGFEELFVGSTANKIVNLAPCPVITIPPNAKSTIVKSIVLPIDETMHSRQKVTNVVPLAAKIGATVHVLGLVQSRDKSDLAKFKVKLATVEDAVEKAGIPCVKKVVNGQNLAIEAMKYSEEAGADLLAIMTDHESNMTGMFMGAFAKQIINHSKVPVLSIKPITGPYESAS